MPIKRLQQNRLAQFPCIGKLRKGAPKEKRTKNGKEYEVMGKDLGHFRFDTDDKAAMQTFTAYYGAEPKEIQVYLPYGTAEENFQAWMEEYKAGGLMRRCDGETMSFHRNDAGGADLTPKQCAKLCGRACACKEVGRLMIIIPQLARLAYITVETHSVYDIIQLTENLQAAQALRGDLRGIPFILSRREREISTPGDNGRVRRTKSLLFIEPDPEWVALKLEEMRLAARPMIETRPITISGLLMDPGAGGHDEDDDDVIDGSPDEAHEPERPAPQARKQAPTGAPPTSQHAPQGKPAGAPAKNGNKPTQGPSRASQEQLAKLDAAGQHIHGDAWAQECLALIDQVSTGEANAPGDLSPGEANEALLTLLGKAALGDEWPDQARSVCESVGKERLAQLDQKSVDAMIARLEKRLAEKQSEQIPA